VVEHESVRRADRVEIQRLRPPQAILLGDREHELDPDRRRVARVARGQLDQHSDRGLVIGAQDRLSAAAVDAVLEHHLDPSALGDGVQVRAHHHPLVGAARDPGHEIPRAGSRRLRCSVLGDRHTELPQLAGHGVGDRPLASGGAGDLAQPHEAVEHSVRIAHGRTA
jgi:hypothetical protein